MTKLEILEETLEYYSKHNRGLSADMNCVYINLKGDMCAVGRCLKNPTIIKQGSIVENFNKSEDLDKYLKDVYKGHDLIFWQKLQVFHDFWDNWDNNVLTEKGLEMFNKLKVKYG